MENKTMTDAECKQWLIENEERLKLEIEEHNKKALWKHGPFYKEDVMIGLESLQRVIKKETKVDISIGALALRFETIRQDMLDERSLNKILLILRDEQIEVIKEKIKERDLNGMFLATYKAELQINETEPGHNHHIVNELVDKISNDFFQTFRDKNLKDFESYEARHLNDVELINRLVVNKGKLVITHDRYMKDNKLMHRVTTVVKPIK